MRKIMLLLSAMIISLLCTGNAFAADTLYAAPVEGYMSLRISPDEASHEITQIPACAKIEVIEKRNTWGRVIFRKKCGWVNLSFTATDYNKAAEATGYGAVKNVKVSSEKGNAALYSLPSTLELLGSTVKYTVPNDTVLSVSRETQNGWALATMNGKYAWVQLENTVPYESFAEEETQSYGIYYVYVLSKDGAGLPLMSDIKKGKELAVIPDCIKLTVREEKGNYGYVSYDGQNGWIDLKHTANTLENAQIGAGIIVNKEFTVVEAGEVPLMSVPSDYVGDASFSQGSVKNGETVFVTRATKSGWSFVTANGVRGWIKPGSLSENVSEQYDTVTLCDPYYVYAAARTKKGVPLYPDKSGVKESFAFVPECCKLQVISENGDYIYVYSDYAAGWTQRADTLPTYEEAMWANPNEKTSYKKVKTETTLRTVPIYSVYGGARELSVVPVGTEIAVEKTVVTGKRKWGLAEVDGTYGWINLNCTEKAISPVLRLVITAGGIIVVVFLLLFTIYIVGRILKCGKHTK